MSHLVVPWPEYVSERCDWCGGDSAVFDAGAAVAFGLMGMAQAIADGEMRRWAACPPDCDGCEYEREEAAARCIHDKEECDLCDCTDDELCARHAMSGA